MSKRKKNIGIAFIIGLFVIVGSVIMAGVIIWLGANQFMKEQTFYVTYFSSSVEGLEQGSAVKYQGLPCGRISKISVAPDGRLIEVIMQIDPKIVINDSMRIQAAMAGIAGGKFLQLHYPKAEMAEMYPALSFDPPYKLIKSSPSGLEEMTLAAQQVMNNLLQLDVYSISKGTVKFLDNTNRFLSNEDIYQILENLNQSSIGLLEIIKKVDSSTVFSNAAKTTEILFETSVRMQNMIDTLSWQIVQMKLPEFVDKVYVKYDSLINKTGNSIGNLTYRGESAMMTLQETLEQLKRTNRELQKSLRAISDNPSAVFFSEPPPEEK